MRGPIVLKPLYASLALATAVALPAGRGRAVAACSPVAPSGAVRLVPASPGISVHRVPKHKVRVSACRALRATEKSWGVQPAQVEAVVRASVSTQGYHVVGWVVVTGQTTYGSGPGNYSQYSKLVIVVNGRNGKPVFAYPASPVTSTSLALR